MGPLRILPRRAADDRTCPDCGGEVFVAGRTTRWYECRRCGAIDPVVDTGAEDPPREAEGAR